MPDEKVKYPCTCEPYDDRPCMCDEYGEITHLRNKVKAQTRLIHTIYYMNDVSLKGQEMLEEMTGVDCDCMGTTQDTSKCHP